MPIGLPIRRTAKVVAHAVGSMLRIAADIVFVDPYFAPHRHGYVRVLGSCLRACHEKRIAAPPRVLVVTSGEPKKNGTREFFEGQCRQQLPKHLPAGQRVTIRRLMERQGGERLHNRYVLTEHGGVSFGAGLDERRDATDDLQVLDRTTYDKRWSQYSGASPAFDCADADLTIERRHS